MVVGAVTRAARAKEGLAALRRVVASILDMVGGEKEGEHVVDSDQVDRLLFRIGIDRVTATRNAGPYDLLILLIDLNDKI